MLPEHVAAAVFALTGGDLTHTTGLHVPVDAGVAASCTGSRARIATSGVSAKPSSRTACSTGTCVEVTSRPRFGRRAG